MGRVGVDFGAGGIRLLQVREVDASGRLELVGAAHVAMRATSVSQSASINPDEHSSITPASSPCVDVALAEQIRAAFAEGGFAGRNCVVSLPREEVRVQSIRVPKMPEAELRQTAGWESAQRFGFERDAIEADFIRTGATISGGGTDNREEIILIAAPRAAVQARLELLMAAGLRPVGVEVALTGLVRAFSRQFRREADLAVARVIVEVGATGATILIVRGDQIAFCKTLSISGNLFNRAVEENLQISESQAADLRRSRIAAAAQRHAGNPTPNIHQSAPEPEQALPSSLAVDADADRAVFAAVRPIMNELAKEITLCLRYFGVTFRGQPPQRLVLTGGDALEPRLDEVIARNCNLKVAYDDAPLALTNLSSAISGALRCPSGPGACWATAFGAGLRGLGGKRVEKRSGQAPVEEKVAA